MLSFNERLVSAFDVWKTLPAGEEYKKDLKYLLQLQSAINESLENEIALGGKSLEKNDGIFSSHEILGENIPVKQNLTNNCPSSIPQSSSSSSTLSRGHS